ncbi:MAG: efflux RND transporter periplasmic adaptor subunit [Planctomycetota bacterium]
MKSAVVRLLVLALVVGGGYYGWKSYSSPAQVAGGSPPKGPMPPMEVPALKLVAASVELADEIPGRTAAYRVAQIRPQVDGILLKQLFEEGSVVEAGAPLYQIDDALYKAAHTRTLADVARAEANLKAVTTRAERAEDLVKVEAVSRQEHEDLQAALALAKADVEVARASEETARIRLGYTRVSSPIKGRVGKSMVTEGALVMANQPGPLATVTQLDPIYVDMTQTAQDAQRLRMETAGGKTEVRLLVEGGEGLHESKGELKFSDVSVDPSTGTVPLRALFPNPDHRLLPGLFVRARVVWGHQDVILVPQKAAQRNPGGSLLAWVVDAQGGVKPTPFKADRAVGDQWLVTEGLKAGDVVMLEGFMKLAPGMTVKPVFETEARKHP